MSTSMIEAELRLVGAAKLLNHALQQPGKEPFTYDPNWARAQELKSQAWQLLYEAWFALKELNEDNNKDYGKWQATWLEMEAIALDKEGNVYVTATNE